jgi:hypothetical protein
MTDEYFDDTMRDRQRLLWGVATRRQLERWEPLVAAFWRTSLAGRHADGALVWAAEIEHHFALIAAHHLLDALELPPASDVPIDPILRDELAQRRDLLEHWEDNLPVFMVTPRPGQPPRRSGRGFAARNPGLSPYWWLRFDNKRGALLMPKAPAPTLHSLLDAVEAEVLAGDPGLADYVPPRAPSPWIHENGEWWPKADDDV